MGQASRALNLLGSWSTYRDLNSIEQVPERVAQVVGVMFGLKGLLEGHPYVAGVVGVMIGAHAMEQATAGVATTAVRLFGRGRPLVQYNGVTVRQDPTTPLRRRWLNRLTGGRTLDMRGYYFFEGGRTWSCQSATFQVGDTPKTLTRIGSLSIPNREFYFDRPIFVPEPDSQPLEAGQRTLPIQRVVDTVLGGENPDTIPGFIGSTNELENGLAPPLGHLKRALFMANWLLVDEAERDISDTGVDYLAVGRGTTPGGGGVYQPHPPTPGGSPGGGVAPVRPIPAAETTYPSLSRTPPPPLAPSDDFTLASAPPLKPVEPPPAPYGTNLFNYKAAGGGSPQYTQYVKEKYKDRLRIGQREFPLVVKRVVQSPFGDQQRKADAVIYDEESAQWRVVDDEEDRISLARAVAEGQLRTTPAEEWPV
jgi:hypothetical protein